MGILTRFKDIISSNVNDFLDKSEDPVKMCDQYIREAGDDLKQVERETAETMAEEKRIRREIEQCTADAAKYLDLAKRALSAGSEEDAKVFLAKKQEIEARSEELHTALAAAEENSEKMRQLREKLTADIGTLKERRDAIAAKMAVVKATDPTDAHKSGADKFAETMSKFEAMEAKIEKRADTAEAMAELRAADLEKAAKEAETAALERKYQASAQSSSVDDELAALKANMGLNIDANE